MNPWNEEPTRFEELDGLVSNERQVEIARAGSLRVKRRPVVPPAAGDRAPTENDLSVGGDPVAKDLAKPPVSRFIPAKHETEEGLVPILPRRIVRTRCHGASKCKIRAPTDRERVHSSAR